MASPFWKSSSFRFVLFVLLFIVFLSLGKLFTYDKEAYYNYLAKFPAWISGIIFIVLYVTVSFFIWIGPKDIFKIVAALLYGPSLSTLFVYISEMINVIVLFSLSRKLGRDFVEAKLKGKMKRLDETIAETSFMSIFWVKFFPIIPFRFLDLAFGLTKISLKKYFVISLLASPLRIFFVQLFLSLGMDVFLNPVKLEEYLTQHPRIYMLCFAYVFGSIAMIFMLQSKARRKNRP